MRDYKLNDQARDLYINHEWSEKELEIKFKQKMTDYIIPKYLKLQREKRKRAEKQRVINNNNKLAREKKRKQRALKLSKKDAKVFNKHSDRLGTDNAVSKLRVKLDCPINKWLMGVS